MKKIAVILGLVALCTIGFVSSVWARESAPAGSPISYATTEDGRQIPVYLYPEDPEMLKTIQKLGLASKEDMKRYERFVTNNKVAVQSASCPRGGVAATLISEGWDNDDDYFKDYEHPVGWNHDFICMTPFFYAKTGGNPPQEFHNDYLPGIARHRIKIGLSGWPAWLASQQAELRWDQ